MMSSSLLALALLLGQAVGPQPVSPARAALAWDAPTTNSDGTPCDDLAGFVCAITDIGANLNAPGAAPPMEIVDVADGAVTEQALLPLAAGLAPGEYRLWVLAYDEAGNRSAWSDPLAVRLDPVGPGKPGGVRVKVTVVVEVGG